MHTISMIEDICEQLSLLHLPILIAKMYTRNQVVTAAICDHSTNVNYLHIL